MAEITFRDFAGAVMSNDQPGAGRVLEVLLGLSSEGGLAAAQHFLAQTQANPSFMMKAMGLRTAVESGDDGQMSALLGECFGLSGEPLSGAVASLKKRYAK